jgi:hypothetical protein
MRAFVALGAVLCVVLVAVGCGAEGSPEAPLLMVEMSGGIAGVDGEFTFKKDGTATFVTGSAQPVRFRLSSVELTRLKSLIVAADLPTLRSSYMAPHTHDRLHFLITASGKTVDADTPSLPSQLRPVAKFVVRQYDQLVRKGSKAGPPSQVEAHG